jgi:hypothetical protein
MQPTYLLAAICRGGFAAVSELRRRGVGSAIARPVWPVATHKGELTARRLVITFVPTDGLETGGLPSGGCGDSSTEREFPSDKVYRRDNRGIIGVESLIA